MHHMADVRNWRMWSQKAVQGSYQLQQLHSRKHVVRSELNVLNVIDCVDL